MDSGFIRCRVGGRYLAEEAVDMNARKLREAVDREILDEALAAYAAGEMTAKIRAIIADAAQALLDFLDEPDEP